MRPSALRRLAAVLAIAIGLAGCAQQRLATSSCAPRLYPIKLDRASGIETGLAAPATTTPRTYGEAVDAAARGGPSVESRQGPPQHLVLSGGGKWGSFGAGFLHDLPGRAAYRVVTGVSTGALQASFVFLGDETVPAARAGIYSAANDLVLAEGAPQAGAGRRFIDDLPLAYTVTRPESVIVVKGGLISALRNGAAGDFAPLRKRLALFLDRDMLGRIAAAGDAGRGLFVGVIDVDDGQAYAADMVDLARRAVAPGADFDAGQRCYIDVLVASSSEPLQAKPVFFQPRPPVAGGTAPAPHMYIDGGVRAGVFLQEVLDPSGDPRVEAARPRIDTIVLVNGDLTVDDKSSDPAWTKDWDLLRLGLRSKDILVDQVYNFSVDRVMRFGSARGEVRLATSRGYETHPFAGKDCATWKVEEKSLAFPPTFMRCLIDYGAGKAKGPMAWDAVVPPKPAA